MMNDLNPITFRIIEIQRAGAVAVSTGRPTEGNSAALEVRRPGIDVLGGPDEQPEVIERSVSNPAGRRRSMEGKVIHTGSQVCVVGVRLPFHVEPQHVDIETFGFIKRLHEQRDVTEPQMARTVAHGLML